MEFYREYADGNGILAVDSLNEDVKNNLQWRSEISGYTVSGDEDNPLSTYILVRWVGLSETPFKENEE